MSEQQLLGFALEGGLEGGCTRNTAALAEATQRLKQLLLVSCLPGRLAGREGPACRAPAALTMLCSQQISFPHPTATAAAGVWWLARCRGIGGAAPRRHQHVVAGPGRPADRAAAAASVAHGGGNGGGGGSNSRG